MGSIASGREIEKERDQAIHNHVQTTKKILLQREEVRRNYRPTYLILLPRERQREREREREREQTIYNHV